MEDSVCRPCLYALSTALVLDLKKTFLNVDITQEQRDLLRFLWVDDIDSKLGNVIVLRFTRVVFGLMCTPFILNAVLRNLLVKYEIIDPEFDADVLESLCVDDFA